MNVYYVYSQHRAVFPQRRALNSGPGRMVGLLGASHAKIRLIHLSTSVRLEYFPVQCRLERLMIIMCIARICSEFLPFAILLWTRTPPILAARLTELDISAQENPLVTAKVLLVEHFYFPAENSNLK
jgi:hypothetical protein